MPVDDELIHIIIIQHDSGKVFIYLRFQSGTYDA